MIRILVPFSVTDDELERGLDILEELPWRLRSRVEGARKTYGDVVAVDGVDLHVADGEFFTLLGPSGSGKTTTLRMIAGFEQPDAGRITLGGEDITRRPPYARDVNTVFQDYALFPHMTVAENVGYGLKVKGVPRGDARAPRSTRCSRMVRLDGYGGRKPVQLSGGQRQRVALARSIVNQPKVLLLDEPLGALDLKLRQEMQVFLKALQQELGMTFLYVTHDQEEALTMSDHVAVFNEGRIEQVGAPAEIYERPATEFVAGFVGTSNILERDGRRFSVRPERIALNGQRRSRQPSPTSSSSARSRATSSTPTRGERLTVVRQSDGTRIEPRHARCGSPGATRTPTRFKSNPPNNHSSRRPDDEAHVGAASRCSRSDSRSPPPACRSRRGGTLNMIAWEGYTQPQWVKPFEKQTGCTIHAKYARLLRRDGDADAHRWRRPVRHGLRVRRREPAPDLRQGRPAGRRLEDPRLQELRQGVPVAAEQHGRRASTTASRCSGARTRCSTTRRR